MALSGSCVPHVRLGPCNLPLRLLVAYPIVPCCSVCSWFRCLVLPPLLLKKISWYNYGGYNRLVISLIYPRRLSNLRRKSGSGTVDGATASGREDCHRQMIASRRLQAFMRRTHTAVERHVLSPCGLVCVAGVASTQVRATRPETLANRFHQCAVCLGK